MILVRVERIMIGGSSELPMNINDSFFGPLQTRVQNSTTTHSRKNQTLENSKF